MQRVKMGKKKNEQQDVKWKHSSEAVEKGKISYMCKFLGSTPVSHSKGSELIKESIKKLQFANDIKKSEEGLKASKLKKVEFCVSVQNLVLTDIKSKTTLYSFPLQRISYCADDKSSKKYFGFIAREKEKPQHHCYVLEAEKNAEELTLAVGQAFELAYKKFKASQPTGGKKEVDEMKQRVQSTEKENEMLKKKLEQLEKTQQAEQTAVTPSNEEFVRTDSNNGLMVANDVAQPAFDPFSFDSGNVGFFETADSHQVVDQSPQTPNAPSDTNPFAASAQQGQPTSNHQDLLNMFSASESQPVTSSGEGFFDPLSNHVAPSQGVVQPQPEANFPLFDQAAPQQNEVPFSLSRPKPTTLSAGLLPPPPTKQDIKAAQKQKGLSTPDNAKLADPFATGDPGLSSNSHQGIQELQHGMDNNLVLF